MQIQANIYRRLKFIIALFLLYMVNIEISDEYLCESIDI